VDVWVGHAFAGRAAGGAEAEGFVRDEEADLAAVAVEDRFQAAQRVEARWR